MSAHSQEFGTALAEAKAQVCEVLFLLCRVGRIVKSWSGEG